MGFTFDAYSGTQQLSSGVDRLPTGTAQLLSVRGWDLVVAAESVAEHRAESIELRTTAVRGAHRCLADHSQ
ncbi:MAG: hypothetical protein ACKN81_20725 [Pirellulaceae bacterium]